MNQKHKGWWMGTISKALEDIVGFAVNSDLVAVRCILHLVTSISASPPGTCGLPYQTVSASIPDREPCKGHALWTQLPTQKKMQREPWKPRWGILERWPLGAFPLPWPPWSSILSRSRIYQTSRQGQSASEKNQLNKDSPSNIFRKYQAYKKLKEFIYKPFLWIYVCYTWLTTTSKDTRTCCILVLLLPLCNHFSLSLPPQILFHLYRV